MFAHFSNLTTRNQLLEHIPDCVIQEADLRTRYHFQALEESNIIFIKDEQMLLSNATFGLLPQNTKSFDNKGNLTSAQAENITTQRSFRMSIRTKRCIVPADSFYIKQKLEARRFYHNIDRLILMAGVYDEVQTPNGAFIRSFAVVTKRAVNKEKQELRVPYCLIGDDILDWIDPSRTLNEIIEMLQRPLGYEANLSNHYIDYRLLAEDCNDDRLHKQISKERTLFNL